MYPKLYKSLGRELVEPTIKFVSESDAVKERQLKAFAASLSAFGQKLSFNKEELEVAGKTSVTVIDPSVQLSADQLENLPQLANPYLLRFLDSFISSTDEQSKLRNLLDKGVDIGILKKNDYFEMPLMRLILLNALGSKSFDLHHAMPWGGIKETVNSSKGSWDSDLDHILGYYKIDNKLVEELKQFKSFVVTQLLGNVEKSKLNFVADGVRLGMIFELNTDMKLDTNFLFEVLQNSIERDRGQVLIQVVNSKELQISYFINNIEEISLDQSMQVGWFLVGVHNLGKIFEA